MGAPLNCKILITTSGLGSRLGERTNYTNKCLMRVDSRPVISHIIESYPKKSKFVITLGHFGKFVRDFLLLAYPDKNFTFVEVDNYSRIGSSLGYSILKAKKELQCPFIFHASDSIIIDNETALEENWLCTSTKRDTSHYRTVKVQNNKIITIEEKGSSTSDFVYTGVCGIFNYEEFWNSLEKEHNKNAYDSTLSDCHALRDMLSSGIGFKNINREFFDTGNVSELLKTREKFKSDIIVLDKLKEDTFIINDIVVKFFYDSSVAEDRVERAKILEGCVPEILGYRNNFYSYKFVKGSLFAESTNTKDFIDFLKWSENNLWKISDINIREECKNFLINKTKSRISAFIKDYGELEYPINGLLCDSIEELIKDSEPILMNNCVASTFHGDFILDNVLRDTNKNFVLIDWRQNFGSGVYKYGDIYYDFSKLNHNLIFNHSIIKNNGYRIEILDNEIFVDILRRDSLCRNQEALFSFLQLRGFDIIKTKILTSIIWINMAPLHDYPLSNFLFYFGKYNLQRSLNEYKKNA